MKKEYITPELDLKTFSLSKDVLALSVPEQTLPGQGDVSGPGDPNDDF